MGQVKPVQVDHHRQQDPLVLSNAEGTDDIIHRFLTIFDKELNPAGITDGHSIGVVSPDT